MNQQTPPDQNFVFKEPEQDLILANAFKTLGFTFRVGQSSERLNQQQVSTLVNFAEGTNPFPARNIVEGRTLYCETDNSDIKGLKMKGAGGVERAMKHNGGLEQIAMMALLSLSVRDRWICTPPEPFLRYNQMPEPHFYFDENLNLKIKISPTKAKNCLAYKNAIREYENQRKLKNAGIGFDGLLEGQFFDSNSNRPIVTIAFYNSYDAQPIGVAFSEYDSSYELLGNFLKFCLVEDSTGVYVAHSEVGNLSDDKRDYQQFIDNYLNFSRKTGATKAAVALEAQIARHAGHYDNFLVNPRSESERMYVSDTDSCISYEELEENMHGPQFLRDLGMDLLRNIYQLTFSAFTPTFLQDLEDNKYNLVLPYLKGFFSDRVNPKNLETIASDIQQDYLRYVKTETYGGRISWLERNIRKAVVTGDFPVSPEVMQSAWGVVHTPFLASVLKHSRKLIQKADFSDVSTLNLVIPEISDEKLKASLTKGVNAYLEAINASEHFMTYPLSDETFII